MRYARPSHRVPAPPYTWIDVEPLGEQVTSHVLRRAGAFTPYLAEIVIEDAVRCGRQSRISVVVAEEASDEMMRYVRDALARAVLRGAVVVVSRGRAVFASAVRPPAEPLAVAVVLELAARIGASLRAIEEERGVAELFVASRGGKMRGELPQAETATDVAIDGLARLVREHVDDLPVATERATQSALAHLVGRDAVRTSIAECGLEPQAVVEYYSAAVRSLLDAAAGIADATPDTEASRLTKAFLALLRVRESVAVERGQLALALEASLPWQAARAALHSLMDAQTLLLDAFAQSASPEAIQALRRRSTEPAFAEVARLEQRVLEGDQRGLDAHTWFRAATAKLERLREVEAVQLAALRGSSRAPMLH